jgi:uncharacterized protein YjdB
MVRWARIVCLLGAAIVLATAVGLSACGGAIGSVGGNDGGADAREDVTIDSSGDAEDAATRESGADAAEDVREDATLDSSADVADGASEVSSVDGGDAMIRTVDSVAVSPGFRDLALGCPSTFQFTATATYSDGTTGDVTALSMWSSSALAVAAIDASTGLATGVALGTTTITAMFEGMTGTATLAVVTGGTIVSITLTPATASVAAGGTKAFTATALHTDGSSCDVTTVSTWLTSAAGVATVSSGGLAAGVAAGTAMISAAFGGITGTATLTVTPVLTAVSVSPPVATLNLGEEGICPLQFHATAIYSDGTTADVTTLSTWSSSTPSVATIGASTGLPTTVSTGTTTITAEFEGMTGTATLTVVAGILVSISVTPTPASVSVGGTRQFTATANFSDGSSCDATTKVNWLSSATGTATVSSGGLATGVAAGPRRSQRATEESRQTPRRSRSRTCSRRSR